MKPKFVLKKKIEKYSSNSTNSSDSTSTLMTTPLLVIGNFEYATPSGNSNVLVTVALDNTPICTMSPSDSCPTGYKLSDVCSTVNTPNKNICVLDSSYAPSGSAGSSGSSGSS
jgi:hypothetical protein